MKIKRYHGILAAACMCWTALGAEEKKPEGAGDFDDFDWPQTYETSSGIEIALHQPQIDEWTDYRHMVIRAAVAVKPKGAGEDQITYGALTVEADTTVDKEKRVVFLGDRTVKSLVFPNAPDEATGKGYEMEVKSLMNPTRPLTINLDRVLANVERAEQQNKVVGIGVEPPPVFFSSDPAILVIFIGPAKFQQIDGSELFFGANTNWDDHWRYCSWHYHASHWSYGCGAHYDWHHGGYYREGYRAYGPYGGAGFGAVYNPWTGGYARGGSVYGPRGVGFARQAYNPWTNTYGARVGASTPYGSWGKSVVRRDDEWVRSGYRSGARGTVGGIQTSKGGGALKIDRRFGSDTTIGKNRNDDLYVGKDDKVYRKEQGGNWNKLEKGGWKGVDRPTTRPTIQPKPGATRPAVRPAQLPTNRPSIQPKPTPRPSIQPRPTPLVVQRTTTSQLQRDSVARQRGSTRTIQSRQTTRSRSSGSRGGGFRRR